MPDTSETPETTAEVAPETPAPQYATREDFERITAENRAQYADLQRSIAQAVSAVAAPRHAAPAPDADLSDEQLQAAVDEGRMTSIQAARYVTNMAQRRFAAEHIDPMRATGAASISSLSKTTMMAMNDGKGNLLFPHFRRFEKEIDDYTKQMPPGTVMTPELYGQVYRFVVGGHVDELQTESREAALRGPATSEKTPGARSGRQAPARASAQQAPDEVFGFDVGGFVDHHRRGRSLDDQARAMGYANWAAYQDMAAAQEAN